MMLIAKSISSLSLINPQSKTYLSVPTPPAGTTISSVFESKELEVERNLTFQQQRDSIRQFPADPSHGKRAEDVSVCHDEDVRFLVVGLEGWFVEAGADVGDEAV